MGISMAFWWDSWFRSKATRNIVLFAFVSGNILYIAQIYHRRRPPIQYCKSFFNGALDTKEDLYASSQYQTKYNGFNKSIIYLKPHKTGSESFKKLLIDIANYYNLTTNWGKTLPEATNNSSKRKLSNLKFDILLQHKHFRTGVTTSKIRGWDEGDFKIKNGIPPKRKLLKIITIRNPIERLVSHYFSQRRFGKYIPKRGIVDVGTITTDEEIDDFLEWLEKYPANHQVLHNVDQKLLSSFDWKHGDVGILITQILNFFDYIVVADQWKLSLCLFGFKERIAPHLLRMEKRNVHTQSARRFDLQAVLAKHDVYQRILKKIDYDFRLYHVLFQKYNDMLQDTMTWEFLHYCNKTN